jgi:hypothetical protein
MVKRLFQSLISSFVFCFSPSIIQITCKPINKITLFFKRNKKRIRENSMYKFFFFSSLSSSSLKAILFSIQSLTYILQSTKLSYSAFNFSIFYSILIQKKNAREKIYIRYNIKQSSSPHHIIDHFNVKNNFFKELFD